MIFHLFTRNDSRMFHDFSAQTKQTAEFSYFSVYTKRQQNVVWFFICVQETTTKCFMIFLFSRMNSWVFYDFFRYTMRQQDVLCLFFLYETKCSIQWFSPLESTAESSIIFLVTWNEIKMFYDYSPYTKQLQNVLRESSLHTKRLFKHFSVHTICRNGLKYLRKFLQNLKFQYLFLNNG